jgi:hypothetical protein
MQILNPMLHRNIKKMVGSHVLTYYDKKMEEEVLRDEQGDVVYHLNGTPQNNMIGALTTLILEH